MLVTGKNDLIIDDMFAKLRDTFDILCCSSRYDDRNRHIDLLEPQVFVICLNDESIEEMTAFTDLKRKLTSKGIYTVVIGREEECDVFNRKVVQLADLSLTRPITAEKIKLEIVRELEAKEREREEQAQMLEQLQNIRKQQESNHVLVVDDDPMMLKLIKEYLGDKYHVATAISGKIAEKFLETKETNLILLDYAMPGENGVEVLKKIRANERLANIPVVFLTGVTDKEMLLEALAMKPQGYLLKPIDRDKLLGTVEKYIG